MKHFPPKGYGHFSHTNLLDNLQFTATTSFCKTAMPGSAVTSFLHNYVKLFMFYLFHVILPLAFLLLLENLQRKFLSLQVAIIKQKQKKKNEAA